MGWTSSTAVVSAGINGAISTTSNNALIMSDWSGYLTGNELEVYGTNDTIVGGGSSDAIDVVLYPALGMKGDYAYIIGDWGDDIVGALAIQGEQHTTLVGGWGSDTFTYGCNADSTLNVEIADYGVGGNDSIRFFYEGYQPGCLTCYSTDSGLLITDNAGRLTVKFNGVYDYNYLSNVHVNFYPYSYHGEHTSQANWQYVTFGSLLNYGGMLMGLSLNGNTLSVNDWHSGGVVTNGVYGYEGIVVIDDTQSTQGKYLGGNAQANQIYAGSGGDTLWGAANNDILVGGAGADDFLYGTGEGADFLANADAFDTVSLYNLRLSDLGAVVADNGTITLAQDASNAVTIQFNGTISPVIALGDGSRYRYDNTTAAWQAS